MKKLYWTAIAALVPIYVAYADTRYVLTDLGKQPKNFIAFTGKGLDLNSKGHIAGARNVVHTDPARTAQIGIPGDGVIDTNTTLGGTHSTANAINEHDYLTGLSETASGEVHAFLWDGSIMTDLGTLGGTISTGMAINSSGHVTGDSELAAGGFNAVLWDDTGIVDLGNLGVNSSGRAISDNGLVAGVAGLPDGSHQAFLSDGSMRMLPTLGGNSAADAVNNHGQVAGQSGDVAVVWIEDEVISLGTLNGHNFSNAHSINSAGVVVGGSSRSGDDYSAFVWDGNRMKKLPAPIEAEAWFINDDGVILGIDYPSDRFPHILRWEPSKHVAIDIRPRNPRNPIHPASRNKLYVAILSDETFDAVQVKVRSVRFGPDRAKPIEYRVKDINKDGLADLLVRFRINKAGIECGDKEASLFGKTYAGDLVSGADRIRTLCQ